MKLIVYKKMKYKIRTLYLLSIILAVGNVYSQVPAGHLCSIETGQVPMSHGSDVCSGNNMRSYDLSYVYDSDQSLYLYYNSLLSDHNLDLINVGKKFTSSSISYVDLNSTNPYYLSGDGTRIPLERQTTGPLANSFTAKNRDLLTDYFRIESGTNRGPIVKQYAMDGSVSTFVGMGQSWDRYKLVSECDSMGSCVQYNDIGIVPQGGKDGIVVTRTGQVTTLTNAVKPSKWIKLIKDNLGRLATIEYADGTKYVLTYHFERPALLRTEQLIEPGGKSETAQFAYDNLNRLSNIVEKNIPTRFVRNLRQRFTEAFYYTGEIYRVNYDSKGHVSSMKTFLVAPNNERDLLEEVEMVFDRDGILLEKRFPNGNVNVKIVNTFNAQKVLTGYRKFENNTLVESLEQNVNPVTRLSSMDVLKDGAGKILHKTVRGFASAWPYRLTSITFDDGRSERYGYNGNTLDVHKFDANGTKEQTQRFASGLLTSEINYLEHESRQTKTYTYDEKQRIVSETFAGKRREYRYDDKDRVVVMRDEDGINHETAYDQDGFITRTTDSFAAGPRVTSYVRSFFPGVDKKVKTLKETITYPTREVEVNDSFYGEDGKLQKILKNGVLVWEG